MSENEPKTNAGSGTAIADPPKTDTSVDWEAKARALEAEKASIENNYKAMQRNLNQRDAKLKEYEQAALNNQAILQRFEELELSNAVLHDEIVKGRGGDSYIDESEEERPKSAVAAHKVRLAAKKAEEDAKQKAAEAFHKAAIKLTSKLEAYGISREDEDLITWANKFSGPQEALEEFDTFLLERQKKQTAAEAKSAEEQTKAAARAKAEASGELDIPLSGGGTAEGLPMTFAKLGKYIASLSDAEYAKQRDRINAHKDLLYSRGQRNQPLSRE